MADAAGDAVGIITVEMIAGAICLAFGLFSGWNWWLTAGVIAAPIGIAVGILLLWFELRGSR